MNAPRQPRPPLLHRRRQWILLAVITLHLAAFAASHVPARRLPSLPHSDKTMHFAGFLVLATALSLAQAGYGVPARFRPARTMILLSLYAMFDEITQPLVNRYFSWGDILADLLGAAAGVMVFEAGAAIARLAVSRNSGNNLSIRRSGL